MIKKIITVILLIAGVAAFASVPCAAEKKDKAAPAAGALDSSMNSLKAELLSYFVSVSGTISSVEGPSVTIDTGSTAPVKAGMRINAFKEGTTFIHPVTKEPLGKIEMPIGNIEITSAGAAAAKGKIITGKPEDFQGARVKIPERKIKLFFYQGTIDWYLGDAYYHALLDSGRFEIVDTGLQSGNLAEILAEAKSKSAEVAVVLSSQELKNSVDLTQKLYWVSDGRQFSEAKTTVHVASVKQLKFSAGVFAPREGEALLTYKMPFSARRMAVGDFDGDSNPDIAMASGSHVAIYKPDVDLKLEWEFEIPGSEEILWIDSLDINKDGRDEILITTIANGQTVSFMPDEDFNRTRASGSRATVRSYIYKLEGATFKLIWNADDVFIRKVENGIISQGFSSTDGFDGKIYAFEFSNGRFSKGEEIRIPKGINIYDFQYVYAPDGRRALFAWDENGFLAFYNDKGIRTWVSKEDFGGFSDSYKKESRTIMIDKGSWSIKDRLVANSSEILAPKRKSMLSFARGVGYSGSEIRSFWWNGMTVEERGFLDEMGGNILDYTVVGDRLLVLVKPYILNQATMLLKGQNPMGIMLYVFSNKGR